MSDCVQITGLYEILKGTMQVVFSNVKLDSKIQNQFLYNQVPVTLKVKCETNFQFSDKCFILFFLIGATNISNTPSGYLKWSRHWF